MDLYTAIHTRRSIRKFTSQEISYELIEKLLEAGMAAPSAGDAQPWHFIIIDDTLIKERLAMAHVHMAEIIRNCAALITVCADEKLEKFAGFWPQDCATSAQNILLTAHAHGLGAVWLAVYPLSELVNQITQILQTPDKVVPLCLIALGYPDETLPPTDRFKKERIHHNSW